MFFKDPSGNNLEFKVPHSLTHSPCAHSQRPHSEKKSIGHTLARANAHQAMTKPENLFAKYNVVD